MRCYLEPGEIAALTEAEKPGMPAKGGRVKFAGSPRWWDVRYVGTRHVILTRQREFQPKGELFYTIVDWELGTRGPCNQIGQGWGDGTFTELEILGLAAALLFGEVEISHRNRVRISITDTKGAQHDA